MSAPKPSFFHVLRRLGCTPAEVAALGLLALGAVAALGLLWLLNQGPAVPPAGVTPFVPASEGAGASVVTAADVVVHVAGAVRNPGVYTLPGGSRVGEAVSAAGGPLPKAVLDGLNLARALTDGEQVLVPDKAAAASAPGPQGTVPDASGSTAPAAAKVNLNQATVAQLDVLPGIGPVLAQSIVDYRESVGGFTEVGELRDVSGIGEKTFQDLVDLVTV